MATFDEHQLQVLGALLRACRQALQADVRAGERQRADEPYANLAGPAPDEGDEANADLFVDVDHALLGMKLAELRDVDAALQRIARRDYGCCADCGQPIAYERLLARPTALRCAPCQRAHERRFATQPRPSL
ncbi:TraR/DksA family transcriptional regulator [Burkholderia pseudomallei]|uniref:TraR/DksA family transcriptional regulator n=1 Tax=Burkholderia pseudomallei TaxID=28450 RepID=UPI00052AC07A|nr:TraR/DksA C4-type zinc finger protein [Burkholderia pseudomallei]AIV81022.1 prokaryotic dksA/traR C4-type zinc finger family protein [Burkholderia pseudomallei MSHR3965]KGT01563.1 prokaryotic dksA/traR C4-type zinc finger family protein [Burkholderia pseudomallei]KGV21468.1 prokaryotic dksA/traR C4-type zinc finger family protein [Burkholderia pseudomallei MSHR4300]OMW60890.1 conjugal transfer protein TraR [Burkholderia pseudomallei]ONC47408.1 conjugal transfer protein TraR [Burkholderia ps